MRKILCSAFILLSGNAGAEPSNLDSAVASFALTREPPSYQYALVDLDDDNVLDAVVIASHYCGENGCPLWIFRGGPSGFVKVSGTANTRAPVHILKGKANGWHSLAVWVEGYLDPRRQVLLTFSNSTYAFNASYAGVVSASDLVGARQLFFESP